MTEPTPSDLTALRARAAAGDQDAIDELVEQGTVDDLHSLAAAGNSDALDMLVERAGESEDRDELQRLAAGGSRDAADILDELEG